MKKGRIRTAFLNLGLTLVTSTSTPSWAAQQPCRIEREACVEAAANNTKPMPSGCVYQGLEKPPEVCENRQGQQACRIERAQYLCTEPNGHKSLSTRLEYFPLGAEGQQGDEFSSGPESETPAQAGPETPQGPPGGGWADAPGQELPPEGGGWADAPGQEPPPPWQQQEKDKLLKSESQNLPNLLTGGIESVGPSTPNFNCYGYAIEPNDPQSVGWVAGKEGFPQNPGPKRGQVINSPSELLGLFKQHGWQIIPWTNKAPAANEERTVIYAQGSQLKHAAVWNANGVYAKMGQLGTFRFESLNQMSGGKFGNPVLMLRRFRS